MTALRRFLAMAAIATLALLGSAGPALAHNVLVSSDPAAGAVLDTAPEKVTFTFDQPIENFDPALKVFGPGGNDFTTAAPTVVGSSIWAPMAAGPAGEYRAVFRIVSSDGHPVTGEVTFTLSQSAAGTAVGNASGAADSTGADASDNGARSAGLGAWLWVIVGVAVLLVAAAIVIAMRKPRSE